MISPDGKSGSGSAWFDRGSIGVDPLAMIAPHENFAWDVSVPGLNGDGTISAVTLLTLPR
jgi:hypothetical protein